MSSARAAAAQVFVGDVDRPVLDTEAFHHLSRVLRLRSGEQVVASDGAGRWRICRFDGDETLEVDGDVIDEPPVTDPVTVGFALVKGGKAEHVVQKLTELGVDRIVPFHASRSVVRWDGDRATKHLERLERVASESCAQCRRMRLPELGWPSSAGVTVPSTADLLAAGALAADGDGRAPDRGDRFLIIGPEGGWDPGELGDRTSVRLAPLVLRADTAAVTAGVLATTFRDGLL